MVAKIITIAQQKGGAGKTTMAAQLAVAWAEMGRSVAMVDIDPQGSLSQWYAIREELSLTNERLTLTSVSGWRVKSEIDKLKYDYDLLVIDSPPHTDTEARTAIRAADLVVVPLQPSPMDVWATHATIKLCKQEKVPVKMVLNRVNPQARLTEAISGEVVGLAASRFGNRVIFAGSLMHGLGVTEAAPSSPAAEEVRALAREILNYLGRKTSETRKSA